MDKKKPIIGISGSIIIDQGGRFPGYKRSYVNDDYIQSVINAGGIPFIIPVNSDMNVIKQQIEQLDGLILSGGHDVNPLLYGEEPTTKQGTIFPERDQFDQQLIRTAVALDKPAFAICRGIQILNATFGGTMYQDLSYIEDSYIKHDQYAGPSLASHTVSVEEGSYIHKVFGSTVMTNSFHHQAIKDVAPGFKVTARAKDGVIEAIEKEGNGIVIGVQWHPEMMTKDHEKMAELFKVFIEASQ